MPLKNPFFTNPHKANLKVSINSAMIGALFFILTFILTIGQNRFHFLVLAQLVLAIPLLYVSTLTYSKVAYYKQTKAWDIFGWVISYLGNTIILNAVGLMVTNYSKWLTLVYFATTIILMVIYSTINISYNRESASIKIYRFLFFLAILFLGGVLPFILMK